MSNFHCIKDNLKQKRINQGEYYVFEKRGPSEATVIKIARVNILAHNETKKLINEVSESRNVPNAMGKLLDFDEAKKMAEAELTEKFIRDIENNENKIDELTALR